MMGVVRLAYLVGVMSQDSQHGTRAAFACDSSGNTEVYDSVDFEVEFEDENSLLQFSNENLKHVSQDSNDAGAGTLISVAEHQDVSPEAAAAEPLERQHSEHSLLQAAEAVVRRVAAPRALNLAELRVKLQNNDGNAIIAVVVMVGLPLLLGVACVLLVPQKGASPRNEDHARSSLKASGTRDLRSLGVPATAESMQAPSRAPTLSRLSMNQVAGPASAAWDPMSMSGRSFILPRTDSLSSNASLPPSVHRTVCESGALCQALVVPKAAGVTLGVEGDLLPCQQETVVDITMKDSTNNESILRLLISETGKDRGMLLESVLKLPIAILDTGAAVAPTGAAPADSRQVLIRRDMDPSRAPFAVVRVEQGAQRVFKATRGTINGAEGEPLLSVLVDMGGLRGNIVSAEGKLVASMETRSEPGGRTQRFLNICQGADTALVLCVVFAAIKLG